MSKLPSQTTFDRLRKKALRDLSSCDSRSKEQNHVDADDIIIDLVRGLGMDDVADAFDAIDKWYA